MDYSYRNSRYKRRKNRQLRRFIAMAVVSLTAGVLVAGYGIVHLFLGNGGEGQSPKASIVKETISDLQEKKNTPTGSSQVGDEEKEIEELVDEGSVEGEPLENKKKRKIKKKVAKKKDASVEFDQDKAESYFKETAFIGDSRTQGLQINAGVRSPKFFAGRGLNVKNALTEKVVRDSEGQMQTVVDSLDGGLYKKIYISFGINELGWTYPDIFVQRYKELIAEVQKKQETAEIVVYGILPITKEKSDKDKIFNMDNVKKFNTLIQEMCKEVGIIYQDVSPAVMNKDGFLPEEVTPDGIHMNKEYCRRILAYIVNKKI